MVTLQLARYDLYMIKVGLRFVDTSPEHLQYAAQLGVDGGTLRTEKLPGVSNTQRARADRGELRNLLKQLKALHLTLAGMELSRSRITGVLRGDPTAHDELTDLSETIRILGAEGASLVTCGFSVAHADEDLHPWRGYTDEPRGRAGTIVRTFDADNLRDTDLVTWGHENPDTPIRVPASEVWRRLDIFMEHILPTAEAAGVRLAFHPHDPPLSPYRGVEQPFIDPHGLQQLLDRYPSEHVGLLFCLGTMYESGADMSAALRAFGERGKLFAIHFRNVRGIIPRFEEVFQDEGDYNSSDQMRTLHEVGFDGFVMPDHYPGLIGDNDARDRARAWSVGYLRALIQATA